MKSSVFIEATVVGLVLAGALVAAMQVFKPVSTSQLALLGFALGVLVHLGFEVGGGNAWYCKYGAACSK